MTRLACLLRKRHTLLWASTGALVLLAAACGSGGKTTATHTTTAPATSSATTTSSATQSAPATTASTAELSTPTNSALASDTTAASPADTAACSNATVEVNKALNAIPEGTLVVDIEIEGACTVVVSTGYTQDMVDGALKVCQASEAPAYANGATGVNVEGNAGLLAAGTKGSPCKAKV